MIDLTGRTFGRLTVLGPHGKIGRRFWWECRCTCGVTKSICGDNLKSGRTNSCGCLRKEGNQWSHGRSHTSLYNSLRAMKERCRLKSHPGYKNYGGRGITVCEEWCQPKSGAVNFINWALANGYSEGLTIDRIDVNGNYEPSNCRWVTMKEQSQNKRKVCEHHL